MFVHPVGEKSLPKRRGDSHTATRCSLGFKPSAQVERPVHSRIFERDPASLRATEPTRPTLLKWAEATGTFPDERRGGFPEGSSLFEQ